MSNLKWRKSFCRMKLKSKKMKKRLIFLLWENKYDSNRKKINMRIMKSMGKMKNKEEVKTSMEMREMILMKRRTIIGMNIRMRNK